MDLLSAVRWDVIWDYRELFLRGIWMTLLLTVSGMSFGLILGLLIGLGKLSNRKWVSLPISIYIDFIRGTPALVQIMLVHFAVLPTIFGISNPVISGIVALSINCAAYIAEIFRAGILSIDRGQAEAAKSLGMTHLQANMYVVIPQAFKRMIPPLGNMLIALMKDSSLVAMIAVNDLSYAGKIIASATFRPWEAYIATALFYLILTFIFSRLMNRLERKFSYGDHT